MTKVVEKFQTTLKDTNYIYMKKNLNKIIAMWDDHDYGLNDGDITFPLKDQMQKIFLEMIEEPKDSLRWNQ